jgi:hypothetical protein
MLIRTMRASNNGIFGLRRSANFNNGSGECALSDMDRITLSGTGAFQKAGVAVAAAAGKKRQADAGAAVDDVVVDMDYDYLENNCVDEPSKMCDFRRVCGFFIFICDLGSAKWNAALRVAAAAAADSCRPCNWCNLGGNRSFSVKLPPFAE